MTPTQKVALKISETRERLNVLLNKEDRSAEETTELDTLTGTMKGLEIEARAAIAAEDDFIELPAGDTEDKELRELQDNANMGMIMENVIEQRASSGAEKEIQDHYKLAGNQIPLIMLETRAVTPAPATVGAAQAMPIPGVFPDSAAAFMGIDMPTVGVGKQIYPVLATNATVRTPAESAAADETTGSFTAVIMTPARLQAAFFWTREDAASFAGLAESLRMNLSDALSDGLDKQIINGSKGLLNGTNLSNNNVTAVTSYALYRSQFAYGRVDGKYASNVGDLKILMGSDTYGHSAGVFRSDNAGDRAALEDLQAVTGGVQVSAHVPAEASNRQNNVVRLGNRRDAVAAIWTGITLIPDEVTLAKKGQVQVTAVMLYAFQILRAAGFHKQQAQIA